MTNCNGRTRNGIGFAVVFLLALSPFAWGNVFVEWNTPVLPPASSLGVSDIVFSWKPGISSQLAAARKLGYRVYFELPLQQARTAAEEGAKAGWAGIILNVPESERAESQNSVAGLRSAYPKLKFLVLNSNAKQPEMRGSFIIKRDSVLEVSSPTAQPWIDTNLALVKTEMRSDQNQTPLYTFSWTAPDQEQRTLTAADYELAAAEAGAFQADLVLQLDEHLQQALAHRDADAWALWNQVRTMVKFYSDGSKREPAANVAVVVDHLDTSDEVLNLLARHNIPFQVFLATDLTAKKLEGVDVLVVFAKPDKITADRIASLATDGKTVVVVDAHGNYPWQSGQKAQLNEHAMSYAMGSGKVLELSEPVTDPETFARDIRRLIGKQNSLLSLWNGLTTIAVPYKDRGGAMKTVELVNYAAEPLRVQVQVKGSFSSIRYETPDHGCCQSLEPVKHDGFTEFVIPELRIAGRVHLDAP